MKRFIALIMAISLPIIVIAGCAQPGQTNEEKLSIVCTIFPQYDWVHQILGSDADNFEITLLLDNRIDLHNFQPSVSDIVTVTNADLFIYVGGESDEWVSDALSQAVNQDMTVLCLVEVLGDGVKMEEIIEGMEDDHHHEEDGHEEDGHEEDGHEEDDHDDEHHDHEDILDEHVWLSLKNARIFAAAITEALSALDGDNAATFQSNLTAYLAELASLDAEYQAAVDAASYKTLLFGDRFPFRYLVDDYGIDYYAAFPGCSAETEASFETMVFLTQKMDELMLPCVMVTESSDQAIARTIIENTSARNFKIFVLDSMQSVTASDVQNGTSYLSIMESNLSVLTEALQ